MVRSVRILLGVIVGGVVAAALGYGLSSALSAFGLALITPSEEAGASVGAFLSRSGLNFYAIQHIRIVGGGLTEGTDGSFVSILWPVTMWSAVPVVALMFGGFVSAVVSRSEGIGRAWAGAWIALPYAVVLLIVRTFVIVPSGSIRFPEIAGTGFAPESVPVLLSPDLWGTVFYGLIFGAVLGAIGGVGIVRSARSLFRRNAFWPAWVRGALIAVIFGQLAFLMLAALAAVGGIAAGQGEEDGIEARAWATILPAVSGSLHYLSHGVTLKGSITVRPGLPEARPIAQVYKAGLVSGIVSEGKRKPAPRWAYLLVIIPAAGLVYGGIVAARTVNEPTTKGRLAVGFAGVYALLMTVLVSLYTLVVRTAISAGEVATSTTAAVSPSAAQSFALGLVMAFVFGLIGISIYRPHADI